MSEDLLQPPAGVEVYRTSTAEIWIGEDDVVRVVHAHQEVHGAVEARENLEAIPPERRKPRPVLVDMRRVVRLSREARAIYADPYPNERTTALGLIIDSPLSRAIGNFFLGVTRQRIPTRLFRSPGEAHEWLKGFRR